MIEDIFVFDNVIHLSDMSDENMNPDRPDSKAARARALKMVSQKRPDGSVVAEGDAPFNWARSWGTEEMYKLVFGSSGTDMAMAQTVPMFDWFKNWYSPVKA